VKETFDPAWLALREDVDHRSRAEVLLPRLDRWWRACGGVAVLDLGSGTGSNLRYLAPRLAGPERWTLVDHDEELLSRVEWRHPDAAVRTVRADLGETAFTEVGATHLVTASALLDLVSERWLSRLADACASSGCAALFALTYDGTIDWGTDAHPVDALVRRAVNEHQRRDKGLGPALGPDAASTAADIFRSRGYRTWLAPSPWVLGADDGAVARALVDGWAAAASEQRPADAADLARWAERRREAVASSSFALTVGHQDLLALPPGSSADPP
jgi:SAM-dependent methyltransferase